MRCGCVAFAFIFSIYLKLVLYTVKLHFSLFNQDIRFLRKTVDSNSETLKDLLALMNGTAHGQSVSGPTVAGAANTPIVDHESNEKLSEDIERVKRAFTKEKTHLRKYLQRDVAELHEAMLASFNSFHGDLSDYIFQYMNNITTMVKGTETNVGQYLESSDQKLSLILSQQKNGNSAINGAIDDFTKEMTTAILGEQTKTTNELKEAISDSQSFLRTELSSHTKEITAATTKLGGEISDGFLLLRYFADVLEVGNTRLANASCLDTNDGFSIQGRVEVLHNGKWGTVCDDDFNSTDATVVCRSLGYHTGIVKREAYFGRGSGDIWLDDVLCSGTEDNVVSCASKAIGSHNCGHGEDVGVICR